MLVKLCVGDYLTYDGFVNGANGLFETTSSFNGKSIFRQSPQI
jgi:hypothetical protein